MHALVILPTYNEAESLSKALDLVLSNEPRADVLVVDDNSPDGTGAIADARSSRDPRVHVLHRVGKEGLGAAYRAGFRWGLERGYPAMVEMDADLSHPADRLPALLDALTGSDVAIGSRYVPGAGTRNWPLLRQLISRGGNTFVRLALRLPVHDATAGYRAYRRATVQALLAAGLQSEGYCFQVESTHLAWQLGFSIATERESGTSKMSSGIVVEALARVSLWAFTGGRRRPRRAHPSSLRSTAQPLGVSS